MNPVSGRVVQVRKTDLHFSSRQELEEMVEAVKQKLRSIDEGPLARDPRDAAAWCDVERHAAALEELLIGLDAWIEEDEAALDLEIEEARKRIRALAI